MSKEFRATLVPTKKPQVNQPTPPAADSANDKPPTPEELAKQQEDLAVSMGWEKPKKKEDKKADKPAETPPAAAEAPKAPETPPKPGTPPAKPKVAPKKPAPLSPEEIINKTASATAAAVADKLAGKKDDAEIEAPAESSLRPDDQKELRVLGKLAELDPEKYGAAVAEFTDWCTALYKYEEDWLKANPGKQFDPDDEEHEEFFKQEPFQQASFDNDYEEARVELKAEEVYQRKVAPLEQQRRSQEAIQRALPTIRTNVFNGIHQILHNVSPELAALAKGEDGKIDLSPAVVKKIQESDPIAAEVLEPLVIRATQVLNVIELIGVEGANVSLDTKNNAVHAKIGDLANEYESAMKDAPDDVRIVNGKQFITIADMDARIKKINGSKMAPAAKTAKIQELYNTTWSVTPKELSDLMIAEVSDAAKAQIEKQDAIARKKYGQDRAPSDPKYVTPVTPPVLPSNLDKPRAPSATGGVEQVTSGSPGTNGDQKYSQIATSVMFGE